MKQLSHLDIANQLAETPASLEQLLKLVDNDLAQQKVSDDIWCINEVIGHLIWADEFAFTNRIKLMTEKLSDTLPLLDVNQAARDRKDYTKNLEDLLQEFKEARQTQVAYIRTLEPSTLSNSAEYKDRTWLASDFLYEWPFHDYGHITQIMKILRGSLVPYLSDTMRKAVGY